MSEESKNSTNSTPNPTDDEIKDPKAVLEKNKELLGKLKGTSEKAKKLEEELSILKNQQLQTEGKKDDLIKSLQEEIGQRKSKEQKLAWNIISSQVALEAQAKGCVNPQALMKLADFGEANIDLTTLEVAKDDIKNIVEKSIKEHPYLFKKDLKGTKDGGLGDSTPKEKEVSKMTKQEILEALKKLY